MTNQIFHSADGNTVIFHFDDPEAKGDIALKMSSYGLEIYLPDVNPNNAVAFIDLFHNKGSVGCDTAISRGKPEIHLFDPASDEPVSIVYFPDNHVSILLDDKMIRVQREFKHVFPDGEETKWHQVEYAMPEEEIDAEV